jgi:DsbC/DsbD-like thiol-disulfide interchange protein
MAMKRRHVLQSAFALMFASPAMAANPPWSGRLLKGGFDGKVWWAGLHVTLAPKWKTYWRVPGDGGIAPQLDVTGRNLAKHDILYPMPRRFEDSAGSTIGYNNEVVFPIAVEPLDAAQPVQLSVKTFFGVCEIVCIPAHLDADISFDAAVSDAPDQALIQRWRGVVPAMAADAPVTRATVKSENGALTLWLELQQAVGDIFVEGNTAHYFGKPGFFRGYATLSISGAKTADELQGSRLRMTVDADAGPVEQWVTVA